MCHGGVLLVIKPSRKLMALWLEAIHTVGSLLTGPETDLWQAPREGKKMAEKINPETRSRMMAGIRGKDTRPEMTVRSYLHRIGFRFRLHRRSMPGSPDLVLPRWNAAIFVHGCFWHGHSGCRYFRLPKTRKVFWEAKINANTVRDVAAVLALSESGWRVAVVWECALRNDAANSLDLLANFIRSTDASIEIASPG